MNHGLVKLVEEVADVVVPGCAGWLAGPVVDRGRRYWLEGALEGEGEERVEVQGGLGRRGGGREGRDVADEDEGRDGGERGSLSRAVHPYWLHSSGRREPGLPRRRIRRTR